MFKIIPAPLVWWPVTFPGVTEDGAVVDNSFEMRFCVLGDDEHRAFVEESAKEEGLLFGDGAVCAPSSVSVGIVQKIAVDWRGVAAENGEPLKFSPDHLRQLLNVPNAFGGVMRAYAACRAGRPEVRSGN